MYNVAEFKIQKKYIILFQRAGLCSCTEFSTGSVLRKEKRNQHLHKSLNTTEKVCLGEKREKHNACKKWHSIKRATMLGWLGGLGLVKGRLGGRPRL